jgi:hypothetical protein
VNKQITRFSLYLFSGIDLEALTKLPANAAKPATIAPIRAVTNINKNGLSVLKINSETRCANIWPFFTLIHRLKKPQSKKSPTKPEINEVRFPCGTKEEIIKATIAILHQGKNKQARKLKSMMRIVDVANFIGMVYWFISYPDSYREVY